MFLDLVSRSLHCDTISHLSSNHGCVTYRILYTYGHTKRRQRLSRCAASSMTSSRMIEGELGNLRSLLNVICLPEPNSANTISAHPTKGSMLLFPMMMASVSSSSSSSLVSRCYTLREDLSRESTYHGRLFRCRRSRVRIRCSLRMQ